MAREGRAIAGVTVRLPPRGGRFPSLQKEGGIMTRPRPGHAGFWPIEHAWPGLRAACLAAALLTAASLCAKAQTTPAPTPGIVRTPIAGTTLANVTDEPRYFQLLRVQLRGGETLPAPAALGLVYMLTGSLTVSGGGRTDTLQPGAGAVLLGQSGASLTQGGTEDVTFLHWLLLTPGQVSQAHYPAESALELYRTQEPLPGLKAGAYAFNLTRVTFPPHMPLNAPHHRSGGALYYVLSGTGLFQAGDAAKPRPPGTPNYEPYGMVHQWGNPGDEPLTFLAANLNPEGTPAVVPGAPPK
jgi:quercetin dioxygenase-like cupin family protein